MKIQNIIADQSVSTAPASSHVAVELPQGARPEHSPLQCSRLSSSYAKAVKGLVPSVAIAIDGVLAKRSQYVLDALAMVKLGGPSDAGRILHSLDMAHCTGCKSSRSELSECAGLGNALMENSEDCWSTMEAYEDVDFDEINRAMAEGEILGHFVASRFPLTSKPLISDHRYATKAWLDAQCHGPFQSYSLNVDLCPEKVIGWLQMMNVGHYLSSTPRNVLAANAAGIRGVLIDRSWNQDADVPFRVKTVAEFIENT